MLTLYEQKDMIYYRDTSTGKFLSRVILITLACRIEILDMKNNSLVLNLNRPLSKASTCR